MNRIVFYLAVLFSVISCNHQKEERFGDVIPGLASPIQLTADTNYFYLSDFVPNYKTVDSVHFPEALSSFKVNDSVYTLVPQENLEILSEIKITSAKNQSWILCKRAKKEMVSLKYKANPNQDVRVIGSLNKWNRLASKMIYKNGYWSEDFMLQPGQYQYIFVVDGKETVDPENPKKIDNNLGGYNSLLEVGKFKPEDLPAISQVFFENEFIKLETNQKLDGTFAYWQNQKVELVWNKFLVTLRIPLEARKIDRSFIRVNAYNKNGFSNDLLIPLENGEVIGSVKELNRTDRETMIMYFLMVDRFYNGDSLNDEPVDDPDILPQANYYGGDLAGVQQKIDDGYFADLGINTVWLSPIVQNPKGAYGLFPDPYTKFSGYHGYWPVSSIKIDYRFGSDQDLKDIVATSHNNNMNVLLDYVANHVHEEHPVYHNNPDWATNLYLPDGSLNTEKWDEYRLTTWFDTFLPTLDLRKREVVVPLVDSAIYWFKEFNIDGFRHDATKHIDELYWRVLTQKVKEISSAGLPAYQIGETYGSRELVNSYIGSGMLNGQFDFNVYDDAVAVFARDTESFVRLKNSLANSLRYFGYHNQMGYITGNQDRGRFISYAGGDLKFDEDSKYAGWTRNIGVGSPEGYKKLKMLHAFNLTIPGIPVIYYGDEIGLPGGNDPDNRRWMKFENLSEEEADIYTTTKTLIHMRKSNLSLLYGDTRFIRADQNVLVYMRRYFDETSYIFFNKGQDQNNIVVEIPDEFVNNKGISSYGSNYQLEKNKLEVLLNKNDFEIITIKR